MFAKGLSYLVPVSQSQYPSLSIPVSVSQSQYPSLSIPVSVSQSQYPSLSIPVSVSQSQCPWFRVFFWKIMQVINISEKSCKEKITLQDLARNKFPCKILQVIAFLQGSCKILARNAFFSQPGIYHVI